MKLRVLSAALLVAVSTQAFAARRFARPAAQPSPAPAPVVDPNAIELTLDQCIDLATKQATQVLTDTNQYNLTATQVLRQWGQFLPNLNVGATYGYTSGTTLYNVSGHTLVDLRGQTASINVTSSLNLFNGLSDFSSLQSAIARRKSTQYSVDWAKQQVALDIIQTYLQLTLDRQVQDIAAQNLAASQARLRLLEGQQSVGSASVPDLYRQKAETSSDAFILAQDEGKVRDDEILIVRKLRLDPEKSYRFTLPSLKPDEDHLASRPLSELVSQGLKTRLDVQSNEELAASTSWDTKSAAGAFLPRLDLNFAREAVGTNVTREYVNGVDMLNFPQDGLLSQLGNQVEYSLVLQLSWSLFSRFDTKLAVETARTTEENTKIELEDSKLQVQSDVHTAYTDLDTARKLLMNAQIGLEAAQKSYEAVDGQYQVGSASIVDVLTAQAALVQARANQAQALVSLKLQEKTLDYAVGDLLK